LAVFTKWHFGVRKVNQMAVLLGRTHGQLKRMSLSICGCRLRKTGQVRAVRSRIARDFSLRADGMSTTTSMREIQRGSDCITLVTEAFAPLKSIPMSRALIPMTVNMHEASALATVSVGENASPLPELSMGASDNSVAPEAVCTDSVLKSPRYIS